MPEHALNDLIRQLQDPDPVILQEAMRALIAVGSPAVEALLGVLEKGREEAQWRAAQALGEIGDARAVPALVRALESPHWLICRSAVLALGKIGSPDCVAHLWGAENHRHPLVSAAAAELGTRLGQPSPESLLALLEKGVEVSLRLRAAGALAQTQDRSVLAQAQTKLRVRLRPSMLGGEPDGSVRAAIAAALQAIEETIRVNKGRPMQAGTLAPDATARPRQAGAAVPDVTARPRQATEQPEEVSQRRD